MTSKRRIRRNSCETKVAHATAEAARQALVKMRKADPANDWLSVYRCSLCHRWHLGHLPSRVRDGILERRSNSGLPRV